MWSLSFLRDALSASHAPAGTLAVDKCHTLTLRDPATGHGPGPAATDRRLDLPRPDRRSGRLKPHGPDTERGPGHLRDPRRRAPGDGGRGQRHPPVRAEVT